MKFLIWQTAFLGDVVLTTPLIETIKANFPNARISFVGKPFILELLRGFDIETIPFSKTLRESFSIIKRIKDNDVALVPHRSLRSALIILASRIPTRIGFKRSEFPFAFTHRVDHDWNLHEVDRNLTLLKPLGVSKIVRKLKLYVEESEVERVLSKFSLKYKGFVVINPFSNFPLKEWALENWAGFIRKVDRRVVVIGLPKDRIKVERLKTLADFIDLVGKTSLRELMALIKASEVVVSNDSAPVHIANALGVPALTVYTSTSSKYGFYPLIGGFLDNPSPCSPCSPNPKKCLTGTKECLYKPSPDLVLEAFYKIVGV